jgi:hypothetical protein
LVVESRGLRQTPDPGHLWQGVGLVLSGMGWRQATVIKGGGGVHAFMSAPLLAGRAVLCVQRLP